MTSSVSEAPYYKSNVQDEGVLGVRVFNQFGSLLNKEASLYPPHIGGHPEHFPPSIDIFLWGSLSTSVQDAMMAFAKKQGGVSVLLAVVFCVVVLAPLASDTLNDLVYATYASMLIYSLVVFIMMIIMIQCTVVCFLGSLHSDMQRVVQEPMYKARFARAGYDIEYCVETGYCSLAILSYIRLTPMSPQIPVTAAGASTSVKFTSQIAPTLPIRLMTFDFNSWGCCGNGYEGNRYHSCQLGTTKGFPKQLQPVVNRSVFGALSEAVRPVLTKYWSMHSFLHLFLILYFTTRLVGLTIAKLGGLAEDIYMFIYLGVMLSILVFHRPWIVYMARNLHQECEAAVLAIAHEIEERSDYYIHFVKPGDGTAKSSFWTAESYIELVPKNSATANEHDGLVAGAGDARVLTPSEAAALV